LDKLQNTTLHCSSARSTIDSSAINEIIQVVDDILTLHFDELIQSKFILKRLKHLLYQ